MKIRDAFKPVELLLSRLFEYSNVFNQNNFEHWPHLKNKEDHWNVIKALDNYKEFRAIYCDGRDLAVFMSSRLQEFNYPDYFPTLKSFVDSFDAGWIYQIDELKTVSQLAKDKCLELNSGSEFNCVPWAIEQMIRLFDEQISLLLHVKHVINSLKESEIYRWESGKSQITFPTSEYNKILELIHSTGKMFERLPCTYSDKDEEALRDHFLVSLKGAATGETFNKKGKTDILVRNGDSNEFIGECKFWRGKQVFLETLSQLLKYLSWRDTRTAVILFVPNIDFTNVINTMKESVSEHPNYLRMVNQKDETWYTYEFRMNEDRSRVVNMAIMLYHLPPPK